MRLFTATTDSSFTRQAIDKIPALCRIECSRRRLYVFECVCVRVLEGGVLPMLKCYRPLVRLFIASLEDEQMVAASERNVLRVQSES